jgi:hypothetical protein
LTEAEFTKLATEAARRDYPNDRPDVAFSKYFQSNEVVQRAHQIVKGTATIMPVFVDADVDGVNDPEDALAQLEALVAQLRASAPWMSKAQAFSRVYQDPTNIELVKRERLQNRPRAG